MTNLGVPGDFVRERTGWNSAQGDYGEAEYEGTRDYIASIFAMLRGGTGILECERIQQGAKWLLRVRVQITPPGNSEEAVIDEVRSSPNRVQKSIFEPPSITGLSAEVLRRVRKAVLSQSDEDFIDMVELNDAEPNAYRLYVLATQGVEFHTIYQTVIFRTRSAPAGHQWPSADFGVGKLFDNAGLFDDASLAGVLNFVLPATGEIVTQGGEQFLYAWLKHKPWYDTAAGNRTVEYREYEYGLWPLFLFEEA